MIRYLVYWISASLIIGATYSFLRGVEDYMSRHRIEPENDSDVKARMALLQQREAANEVDRL